MFHCFLMRRPALCSALVALVLVFSPHFQYARVCVYPNCGFSEGRLVVPLYPSTKIPTFGDENASIIPLPTDKEYPSANPDLVTQYLAVLSSPPLVLYIMRRNAHDHLSEVNIQERIKYSYRCCVPDSETAAVTKYCPDCSKHSPTSTTCCTTN